MSASTPARFLRIRASHALLGRALAGPIALRIDRASGTIAAIGAPADVPPLGEDEEERDLGRRVLLPGALNTHAHAFQVLLRGRADDACSFRSWVDDHLYPLVASLDEEDLETSMLLAFSQMALGGTTTVAEFFYIHDGRGNRLDDLAIRCARRVGLRTSLLRTMYDLGARPAQRRFHESVEDALAHTRALANGWAHDPLVSVLPAPHSLHGASARMIEAGAALARERGTPWHIHLAEQRGDLDVAREKYGTTPLRALAALGVVDERLVIVHGCWLDREEWSILGAARGGLAYNPSANMFLGDGMTEIEAAIGAGVTVSLGCDGPGGNNQIDVFSEMRAAELLARARTLRMGVLPPFEPEEPCVPFLLGTRNGARNLGLAAGALAPGLAGDVIALDPDDLSLAPHHDLETGAFLRNLVYAGDVRSALRESFAGGHAVVEEGRLARIDPNEIRARVERWEKKVRKIP
jgi:5-methylthioadenosine/S-adenosylhomocysteine deaminase